MQSIKVPCALGVEKWEKSLPLRESEVMGSVARRTEPDAKAAET